MFKFGSVEEELFRGMEEQLIKNQTEKQYGFQRIAKATDYLNCAAEIFEQAGMIKEALEITTILENLLKTVESK